MKQTHLSKALVAGSALVLSGSLFAQTMSLTPATNSVSPAGSIAPIATVPGTTPMAGPTTTTGFSADPFQPGTSIKQTKHNLGRTNVVGSNFFDGTDEICVFCHTPHGGAGESSAAPLWNRQLAASSTYQTYTQTGSSTLEGTVAAVGSVSLACLSCHDGTQAMNANYNGPGAGAGAGYLASATGGFNPASAATEMNGTWSAFKSLGGMTGEVAWIGTDLRNDHPIGIPFCGGTGGNAAAYTPGQACNNDGFNQNLVQSKTMNGIQVFWVETGAIGSGRQKEDLRLYPDNRNGTIASAANVECASCHDPHTAANPTFLRVSNSASGVCLTCHNK